MTKRSSIDGKTDLEALDSLIPLSAIELLKCPTKVRDSYKRGHRTGKYRWRSNDFAPPVTLPRLKFLEGKDP